MGRAIVGDFMLPGAGVLKPLSDDQGPGEAVSQGASWGVAWKGAILAVERVHADTIRLGIESLWSGGGRERAGNP